MTHIDIKELNDPFNGIVGAWRSVVGKITDEYMKALCNEHEWGSFEPFSFLRSYMEFEFMTTHHKNQLYYDGCQNHQADARGKARKISDEAIRYVTCMTCGAETPYVGDPVIINCVNCGLSIFRYTWNMCLEGGERENTGERIRQLVRDFEDRHGLHHSKEYEMGFSLLERGLLPEEEDPWYQ